MVGVHGFRKLPALPIPNGIVLCMSTSDAAGRDDKQLALVQPDASRICTSGRDGEDEAGQAVGGRIELEPGLGVESLC